MHHFVHKPNSVCKTKLIAALESDEHKLGKQLIVDWLRKRFKNPAFKIVTEKIVATVDGRHRKIDVAVVYNGKVVQAHECQLSPICTKTEKHGLLDRTLDYYKLGISVTWWLGDKADSLTILDFFESIEPGLSKNGKHSRISEPFHLWAYPVGYPNAAISRIIRRQKEIPMVNTQQENLSYSSDKVFTEEKLVNTSSLDLSNQEIAINALKSLIIYSNPQTVKQLIKEAIANALEQNPSDATALCFAWEKIQPTIKKPIEHTPFLASEITETNLSKGEDAA